MRDAGGAFVRLSVYAVVTFVAMPLVGSVCAKQPKDARPSAAMPYGPEQRLRATLLIVPGAGPGMASNVLIVLPMRVSTLPDPRASYDQSSFRARSANDPASLFDPITRSLQMRGSGIFDVYRRGHQGFRLSVGERYHMRYGASDDGPGGSSAVAALMRLPRGAVNLRDGYEWYAPVAMVGYDRLVGKRLKLGVEGGMMVGRANGIYGTTRVPGLPVGLRRTNNPVADVVMTYLF